MVDLELHQLDLRYESLRKRDLKKERGLVASMSEVGQLLPIVLVKVGETRVVVDGYKRVRALRRLSRDVVRATVWEMEEAEALLLERLMRSAEVEGPLEQGWLLREMQDRFSLSQSELARRFDKSISWVSRRLALLSELPEAIQALVRAGTLGAHAAMKHLVPLARANGPDSAKLAAVMAAQRLSTREVGAVCAGYTSGSEATRGLLLTDPRMFLRAQVLASRQKAAERSACQQVQDDLGALGGLARRAHRRLQQGLWQELSGDEREEVRRCVARARGDAACLFNRFEKEDMHAGPSSTDGNSSAAGAGPRDAVHRADAGGVEGGGA